MENQPGENDLFSFRLIDMRRLLAPLILRLTVKFPRSLVLSWNPPPVNAQWRLFHHDAIDQSIRMCHCMSLQYQREKIGFASRALHPIVSLRSFLLSLDTDENFIQTKIRKLSQPLRSFLPWIVNPRRKDTNNRHLNK